MHNSCRVKKVYSKGGLQSELSAQRPFETPSTGEHIFHRRSTKFGDKARMNSIWTSVKEVVLVCENMSTTEVIRRLSELGKLTKHAQLRLFFY